MEDLVKSLSNLPLDWVGDPCLPQRYSWTGVNCSQDRDLKAYITTLYVHFFQLFRFVSVVFNLINSCIPPACRNLTGMGLAGSLPSSINNLTDITNL